MTLFYVYRPDGKTRIGTCHATSLDSAYNIMKARYGAVMVSELEFEKYSTVIHYK